MALRNVTLEEASAHLTELFRWVEQGNEVIIIENNKPKIKLVPILEKQKKRVFGQHQGMAWMSPDFDDPLPDDFWLGSNP